MTESKLRKDASGKFILSAKAHAYHHRLNDAAASLEWAGYTAVCKSIIDEMAEAAMPGPTARIFARWMNLLGLYYFGDYRIAADAVTGEYCMPPLPQKHRRNPTGASMEKAR